MARDEAAYDWTRFEIFFYVRCPLARVFDAWTTPRGLESFFIRKARYAPAKEAARAPADRVARGDEYAWDWWHDCHTTGRVLEVQAPGRTAFTFGRTIVVSVALSPHGEATQVHLVQEGIPDTPDDRIRSHLDCRVGWTYFLTVLKGVLEKGVDVRDTDPRTADSLATAFRPR